MPNNQHEYILIPGKKEIENDFAKGKNIFVSTEEKKMDIIHLKSLML